MSSEAFGRALTELLGLSNMIQADLADRVGASPKSVSRWCRGEGKPKPTVYQRIRRELEDLGPSNLNRLDAAYGVSSPLSHVLGGDIAELPEKCVVHSYKYDRNIYPTGWLSRMMEVEHGTEGPIDVMVDVLPWITLPIEYLRQSPVRKSFDEVVYENYIARCIQRQRDLLERVKDYEVRLLISKPRLEEYLRAQSPYSDDEFIPIGFRRQQAKNVLAWLNEPNFRVGLTTLNIPSTMMLVGGMYIFIELDQRSEVQAHGIVKGVEITGLSASLKFSQQYNSIWGAKETEKEKSDVEGWLKQRV